MNLDMDFSFWLTVVTLFCGVVYAMDKFFLEKRRFAKHGFDPKIHEKKPKEPFIIDTSKSFFSVLLLVLVVRSFVAEPFRIPSGSMIPTLQVGDFLVVTKYSYGLRLPVLNKKIVDVGSPERGDVVVFRYPKNPKVDYIKRIVGLPGDTLAYIDNELYINGKKVSVSQGSEQTYKSIDGHSYTVDVMTEELDGVLHQIQRDVGSVGRRNVKVVVPEGHYFALGDNRNHSTDSRFWGFVPDENLVGKARFIWMHMGWDKLNRIGTVIH